MAKRTVLGVILERIIGLLFFLILLVIANVSGIFMSNIIYSETIKFLNNNLGLIILFSIILFFGELFSVFIFPFNLPYPIINAVGSVFLLTFLFRILSLVEGLVNQDFFPFNLLGLLIYPLVFVIVLIVGYVNIFKNLSKPEKPIKKQKKIKNNWKVDIKKFIEDANDFMNKLNNKIFKKKGKNKKSS